MLLALATSRALTPGRTPKARLSTQHTTSQAPLAPSQLPLEDGLAEVECGGRPTSEPGRSATPEQPRLVRQSARMQRRQRAAVIRSSLKQRQPLRPPVLEYEQQGVVAPARTPHAAAGAALEQQPSTYSNGEHQELFRHRFIVHHDLCIRLPLEASTLLRAFVAHSHLCGVIPLQLEAFRPLSKVRWSPDAERMRTLPNAGGSSLVSEVLAFELLARAFGASLERTELEVRAKELEPAQRGNGACGAGDGSRPSPRALLRVCVRPPALAPARCPHPLPPSPMRPPPRFSLLPDRIAALRAAAAV